MDQRPKSDNPDNPFGDAQATDAALESGDSQPDDAPTRPSRPTGDVEQLRTKAAERDEYLELLQRVRADYANYQKRAQKEIDVTRRYATQPLIAELLPVIDNLERAMQSADAGGSSALLSGIRLVHQQLLDAMARHGVQPIEAQDQPFDPDVHEALMERPSEDKPDRTVLEVLQKGYKLHDRVVRPARVIVSTAAGNTATDSTQ